MKHWYVYLMIAVVAELLLWVGDKYRILKSISGFLRYFIVILIASIICWCIYDLVV